MNNNKKKNNTAIIIILVVVGLLLILGLIAFIAFIAFLFFVVFKTLGDATITVGSYDKKVSSYYNHVVTSYSEYEYYFDSNNLTEDDFENNNYYIFSIENYQCGDPDYRANSISINKGLAKSIINKYELGLTYNQSCGVCAPSYNYIAIKLDKDVTRIIDFEYDLKDRNHPNCGNVEYKPMIYIYPKEDMDVEVTLGNSELITTSYPKYNNSWNVFARKDGYLEYEGRTYYGLYWEGKNHKAKVEEDGFVIKGEDTSRFLEEKLEILGLNEREINEFIVYWLPKMEHNKYNYVRFETREEIDKYMPLEISPKPDSVIRIYMNYKALDKEIEVKEQELEKVERKGYSVIEWGGSII